MPLWTRRTSVSPSPLSSNVISTRLAPGGRSDRPSQPHENTNRRGGSSSIKLPRAILCSVMSMRNSPPGRRSAQAALAWVLSRGENVIPIPGMKRRAYLDENVAAVGIELTTEELTRLDAAFPPGAAAGERYTPEVARWAGR